MKFENLKVADKYNYLTDAFQAAYKWLRETEIEALELGEYPIVDGVYAQVQAYETIDPKDGQFENHENHFDIQYVLRGREKFGLCKTEGLKLVSRNEERDLNFYEEPELSGEVLLEAGDFIVVAPEDAHKPRLIAGEKCEVKKVVIKIKADLGLNR